MNELLFTRDETVLLTADELEADIRQREADVEYVRSEMLTINQEAGDDALSDELQARWDEGDQFLGRQTRVLERQRQALSLAVAQRESNGFTPPNFSVRHEDPYDISGISISTSADDLRARAATAIEETVELGDREKEEATKALASLHSANGQMARYLLAHGSPDYRRAWQKHMAGSPVTPAESQALEFARAALAIGADATGGYAIPTTLDPAVIGIDDRHVSPIRRASRVVRTLTNQWDGVTSEGVSSQWQGEAVEAVDNSPTLGTVSIPCFKLTIFIPYSIEVSMDWPQMEGELREMIAVERADAEAIAHAGGDGTTEPQGLVVGLAAATNDTTSGAIGGVATADVFGVDDKLNQRYRTRAQWVADKPFYNAIRAAGTNDGMALWTRLEGDLPNRLIGYDALEASAMPAVSTGNIAAILGDFTAGYTIVDRVGMVMETIPHLFGATNRFPTGQRGMYAYLRTGAEIVNEKAFSTLTIQ